MSDCCPANQSNSCACGYDSSRGNKLCELTRPHNRFDVDKIMQLVNKPEYFCRCCGRLANRAENLCNPMKFKK